MTALRSSPTSTTLKLDLSDLELNDRHSGGLAKVLTGTVLQTKVTVLDVSNNRFLVPGARKLSSAIQHMSLHTLIISGNRGFGPVGCAAVADAALVSGVTALSMRDTSLSQFHFDLGVKQTANLIRESTCLEYLDVSFNCLRPAQFALLCDGIRNRSAFNSKLRHLVLSGNPLGDEGIQLLSNAIRAVVEPNTLLNVAVDACNIGSKGAKVLAHLIYDGFLSSLYMNGNPIGRIGMQALGQSLAPCFGKRCAENKTRVQRTLIPDAPMQCTCTHLQRLMVVNCGDSQSDFHDHHENQIAQSLIISSLSRNGWINASLECLIFRVEQPRRATREVISYTPLPRETLLTLLLCLGVRIRRRLPQELICLIVQMLVQEEYRTTVHNDIIVL